MPERPDLQDIVYSNDLLSRAHLGHLSAESYGAFVRIITHCAGAQVWSYSAPADGWISVDRLYLIMGVPESRSKFIFSDIEDLFIERDGKVYPKRQWFTIGQPTKRQDPRPAIPASIRSHVMKRDGFRCVYCGTFDGPFDIDHVVPYSRGGAHTDPENLVCACGFCNNAKRAKTPEEWISEVAK